MKKYAEKNFQNENLGRTKIYNVDALDFMDMENITFLFI